MPFCSVRCLKADGSFAPVRTFSCPPDEALVAAWRQDIGDYNTWGYPAPETCDIRDAGIGIRALDKPGVGFYSVTPE